MAKATKLNRKLPGIILVNGSAGTVRTLGITNVRSLIDNVVQELQLPFKLHVLQGNEIDACVRKAIAEGVSAIAVGGGDGTISGVAHQLLGTDIPLAVLPLGTMNLFAKAMGMPDSLEAALRSLAHTKVVDVDVGRINGRTFLLQVSLGLHPKIVRMRENLGYSSRLTKILGGVRAFFAALADPSRLRLLLSVDGAPNAFKCPAVVITNNLYGKGHIPFQDRLDEGVLGLYVVKTVDLLPALSMARDLALGNWQDSPHVTTLRARIIDIVKLSSRFRRRRHITASVDGELETYSLPIRLEIKPGVLRLLKPVSLA